MIFKLKFLVAGILITTSLSSCYTTKVSVGDVSPKQPMVKINSEWNHHLLWGLVPLENASMRADDYVGDRKRYMIKTNQSFLNGLVSCLTLGIYSPTSTSYYVPLDDRDYNESRYQNKPQRGNTYERITDKSQRAQAEEKVIEQPIRKAEYQSEKEIQERRPAETVVKQENVAPVPSKVSQGQQGSYKATIYFKDGARMDGVVTEQSTDNKIQIKLPSGLVIESKASDIQKIERK